MRFKAKLTPEQVSLFHSILVPLTKISTSSGNGNGNNNNETMASMNDKSYNNNHNNNNTNGIIAFDNEFMKISCRNNKANDSGIICYSELPINSISNREQVLFLDHRIESTAFNNRIVMDIDLNQLKLAFKSILSNNIINTNNNQSFNSNNDSYHNNQMRNMIMISNHTVIKLAKRQNIPCICIDGRIISNNNNNNSKKRRNSSYDNDDNNITWINVHHAIPIRILHPDDFMKYHIPPVLSLPDIQLEIYNNSQYNDNDSTVYYKNKPLKNIIDKLKNISPIIYLEVTNLGELTIRLHTDGASIRTYCNQFIIRNEGCKDHNLTQTSQQPLSSSQQSTTPLSQQSISSGTMMKESNIKNRIKTPSTTTTANNDNNNNPVIVKVDTKKLFSCLHWQPAQLSSTTTSSTGPQQHNNNNVSSSFVSSALLCLIHNEMIVIHVTLYPIDTGFITYYIPIHYISPDDNDD